MFPGASGLGKGLSIVLILAILAALGTLGYVIAAPKAGEEARVIVGIVNRKHKDMSYWVEVIVDGITNEEIGPVVLVHQEKWEQEVEFLLFRQGRSEVYQMLYIWVDVARGQ